MCDLQREIRFSLCRRFLGVHSFANLENTFPKTEFGKNFASLSKSNRRLQFNERGQLFIGVHNETFSFAMCVSNDRSALGING
jgi:hypothetical protein